MKCRFGSTKSLLLLLLALLPGCAAQIPRPTDQISPTAVVSPGLITNEAALEPSAAPTMTDAAPTPTRVSLPTRKPPATRSSPVPAPSQTTAALSCRVKRGVVVKGELKTDLLRLPLSYRVYLPPCYNPNRNQRYPVLYLFHGQSFTDDQWDRLGADDAADRLIESGEIPPLIIVMPYDRYGGQPTETGFSQAITAELIPRIDADYLTQNSRRGRAVGGLSRGAGWAIHLAISEWRLFGALGAHSPAVFHTDAQRMRSWLDQIPEGQAPRLWIDIGDKDRPEITRSTQWFAALLNEYDIPHEWRLFSGYHEESYWKEHLEQYLRWYALEW